MEDPSGCLIPLEGLDTVYVTGAKANFGNDDSLFCDFGTVQFTDSTRFNDPVSSYSWDFGDGSTSTAKNPSHLYAAPGFYTVRLAVLTQLGCTDTLIKNNIIKIVQRPLIDISGDTVVCLNSSLTHSGIFLIPDTSFVTWRWTFPNGNTSTQQNPLSQTYKQVGTFTVTAYGTNSTGCIDTTQQTIIVNPLPVITIPNSITIQAGSPTTIPATYSNNVNAWLWSPATGLSCTDCSNPVAGPNFNTFYQVAATDVNGCMNVGSILVQVLCQNSNLFIPNTFSPNGDGSNDKFYPRGVGLDRVKVLRIFNRWGEVVFEKRDFPINNAAAGWDGTYKGKKPQADVYVYQAEVFCQNGDIIKVNGNIALIL
jgi:gliding motility-associated-like protein